MSKYRNALPQLSDDLFLTDAGVETVLIFRNGIELPDFAAFPLLGEADGRQILKDYFVCYATIAKNNGVGIILDTPTWRASADWAARLGIGTVALDQLNRTAVKVLLEIQHEFDDGVTRVVTSGNVGPRGDGYDPEELMGAMDAERYHLPQITSLADAGADMICALTLTYDQEAIGMVRAAQSSDVSIPVAVGFTVETDGYLPSGQSLKSAIASVDAATDHGPVYYMINCAHPTHFDRVVSSGEDWITRIRGVRANASNKSHAELDEMEDLDDGNPCELGDQFHALKSAMPNLNILGGCCGTDQRHIEAICRSCMSDEPVLT